MAFFPEYLSAGQVTHGLNKTLTPIGVSEDWGEISDGTSYRVAWPGGSESTNHSSNPDELAEHNMWNPMLELFCHADIGKPMEELADDMGLARIALSCHFAMDILCDKRDTRKCVDAATFDSSQDYMDVTLGDPYNGLGAAGYPGSASTLSCALEVVNRSVSLVGGLPNCSAVSSAADVFPSVVVDDRDRFVFLESCYSPCSDSDASVDVTFSAGSCAFNCFLERDLPSFESVCRVLSDRARRSSMTTPWRAQITPL